MKTLKDKLDNYKGLTLSNEEWLNQRIKIKKDVKEFVLYKNKDLQSKINYLKQLDKNKIYTINAIIGIFEDELKENKKIFGDFENE